MGKAEGQGAEAAEEDYNLLGEEVHGDPAAGNWELLWRDDDQCGQPDLPTNARGEKNENGNRPTTANFGIIVERVGLTPHTLWNSLKFRKRFLLHRDDFLLSNSPDQNRPRAIQQRFLPC